MFFRGVQILSQGIFKTRLILTKRIGQLSGGEKARVALALLLSKPYDCLLLDEPTNDLDLATLTVLEAHLQAYKGALIFVSHDRYFCDKLARRLLVFDNTQEDRTHFITQSSYTEVLEKHKEALELQEWLDEEDKKENKKVDSRPKKPKQANRLGYKEKLEYEGLEKQIEELEMEVNLIEKRLATPNEYEKYGIATLSHQLNAAKEALEAKWQRFEELDKKMSD